MEEHNTFFITWLHNAHAMELNLVEVLQAHEEQATDYPEVKAKIHEHLKETESHAKAVKQILEELGEDTSGVKNLMGSVMGVATGASTAMAEDRLIKNSIADFAAEHMEIATYNALITAAEELGHHEVVSELKKILRDEENMAKWLETNLPKGVKMFLNAHDDRE